MNKRVLIAIAGLGCSLLLLGGCSNDSATPQTPASQSSESQSSESQSSESQSASPSTQPSESEAMAELESSAIKELVTNSYLKFEDQGMTEIVASDGVEYALLYDPGMEDYQAVLVDRSTNESELIYETDYFTIFVLYLMATESDGAFTQEEQNVFLAQDPNYGNIRFFVKDGLITRAEGKDQSWQASFDYSIDEELKEVLLLERQELLDSFEE